MYGKEAGDGLADGELKRQEEAARAETDRLRARIEELAGDLARAEEQVSRLVIAREEVTRVLGEPAGPAGAPAGEPRAASPIGAVTVPPWQEGLDAPVLPGPYPMPRGLGIYALMGGFPVGDGAWPLVPGHGGNRGAASPDGGFPLAGRVACGVLLLFCECRRGGLAGHGDDGRGSAGDRVFRPGVIEGSGGL